jgi:alanine-synthesizing transaminase
MPSSRLPHDRTINATTRAIELLRGRGIEIIDLTVSNPTRVGLHYPGDLFAELSSPRALDYDPQPLGLVTAREAVAEDFARRALDVPASRIALTASTSEAYAWLFKLLCDPGDRVLVPRPSYPLFEHLTLLESIEAPSYPLEYHGTWRIDIDDVRRLIDARARAVLVVSPNNPTGSFIHRDDLRALDVLCAEHDLMLIGDEVFADFAFDAAAVVSTLEAPQATVCSLGGLSKTIGLPQAKLAWIAFGGPDDRVADAMSAYELIADTYLSVSTPVQVALPTLLRDGAIVRAQIRDRIAHNLGVLRDAVAQTTAVSLLPVEAGWSAVLRVPSYQSEESLVLQLLTDDRVFVHPGFFFDFDRESFLVISLLTRPEPFVAGIQRVLERVSHSGRSS